MAPKMPISHFMASLTFKLAIEEAQILVGQEKNAEMLSSLFDEFRKAFFSEQGLTEEEIQVLLDGTPIGEIRPELDLAEILISKVGAAQLRAFTIVAEALELLPKYKLVIEPNPPVNGQPIHVSLTRNGVVIKPAEQADNSDGFLSIIAKWAKQGDAPEAFWLRLVMSNIDNDLERTSTEAGNEALQKLAEGDLQHTQPN